jgi:hypothetical protein
MLTTFLGILSASSERNRRNPLLRIFDTVVEAQRRRADRKVARVVARYGNQLTDSVERSVLRDLGGY